VERGFVRRQAPSETWRERKIVAHVRSCCCVIRKEREIMLAEHSHASTSLIALAEHSHASAVVVVLKREREIVLAEHSHASTSLIALAEHSHASAVVVVLKRERDSVGRAFSRLN
jgi:hypothetical protein